MVKRLLDILFSFFGILILSPLFLIVSIVILFSSSGGIFYIQERVGKGRKPFRLLKFRTMYRDSDARGLLTIGEDDPRVTPFGRWLRKYKLDELPQLWNILIGEMSLVGPRPEVEKYVRLYNKRQLQVLNVRPGLTDYASLEYSDENKLLKEFEDPGEAYIDHILPDKLEKNLAYIEEMSVCKDLSIIFKTIAKIFS